MSLDWSLEAIPNYETLCFNIAEESRPMSGVSKGDRILKPETEVLIWLMMFTGIGRRLTEENIEEFIARVDVYEKFNGPLVNLYDGEKMVPQPLDPEFIRKHIGLATNTTPTTRAAFLKKQFEINYRKADKPTTR